MLLGPINSILIPYSVRRTYGAAIKEKEQLKIQQAKVDKLSPKQ